MMRGRGGECASISATGVPYVQTRQRPRWDADESMRCRHRWQMCVSWYHQRSRAHSPPSRIRESSPSSSSKRTGRHKRNMLRSESSSRMWMWMDDILHYRYGVSQDVRERPNYNVFMYYNHTIIILFPN